MVRICSNMSLIIIGTMWIIWITIWVTIWVTITLWITIITITTTITISTTTTISTTLTPINNTTSNQPPQFTCNNHTINNKTPNPTLQTINDPYHQSNNPSWWTTNHYYKNPLSAGQSFSTITTATFSIITISMRISSTHVYWSSHNRKRNLILSSRDIKRQSQSNPPFP